jgi:hypothetical protein
LQPDTEYRTVAEALSIIGDVDDLKIFKSHYSSSIG